MGLFESSNFYHKLYTVYMIILKKDFILLSNKNMLFKIFFRKIFLILIEKNVKIVGVSGKKSSIYPCRFSHQDNSYIFLIS